VGHLGAEDGKGEPRGVGDATAKNNLSVTSFHVYGRDCIEKLRVHYAPIFTHWSMTHEHTISSSSPL
jgi:hypothetical protein